MGRGIGEGEEKGASLPEQTYRRVSRTCAEDGPGRGLRLRHLQRCPEFHLKVVPAVTTLLDEDDKSQL